MVNEFINIKQNNQIILKDLGFKRFLIYDFFKLICF